MHEAHRWEVTMHVWPHSTGRGQKKDQEDCGACQHVVTVGANDVDDALEKAKLFRDGVKTNPMVWEVPIVSLKKVS